MEPDNEFYDSLEDEDCPALLSLRVTPSESCDSLTIPFYTKETPKAEILKTKRSKLPRRTSSLSSRQSSTTCLHQLFPEAKNKKSYVDLFHARIGYAQGSEPTDTTRAICDDDSFKTARSTVGSDFSDVETSSFVSDSSFYAKFLENEKMLSDQMSSVSCRSGRSAASRISVVSKVSKANSNASTATSAPRGTGKLGSRAKFDKANLKVPPLGGLGPDVEASRDKLDTLKKKQKYGQKVSNQNRVRIMEMKVMKNFKYELKKSSDLNKCAESVLNT